MTVPKYDKLRGAHEQKRTIASYHRYTLSARSRILLPMAYLQDAASPIRQPDSLESLRQAAGCKGNYIQHRYLVTISNDQPKIFIDSGTRPWAYIESPSQRNKNARLH